MYSGTARRASAWILPVLACAVLLSGCSGESTDGPPITEWPAPAVDGHWPADGATGVSRTGPYWIRFTEPMVDETVESGISFAPPLAFDVYFTTGVNDTAWITPETLLGEATTYIVTVESSCESEHGLTMESDYTFSFTTTAAPDMDPPTVVSTLPASGATEVSCGVPLRITFSEPVADPGSWDVQTAVDIDPWPDDGFFEREGNDLVVWHSPFPDDSDIDVTITTALQDLAGNSLEAPYAFSFRTVLDNTRPYLASASPANGATGVSPSLSSMTLTFSEPMFPQFDMPAENVDARIVLAFTGEPEWNEDFSTLRLPTAGGLLPGCRYWALFRDVTDMAGNPIDPNPTLYAFTTSGTADYYPVGAGYLWYWFDSEGPLAGRLGLDYGSNRRVIENYSQSTGDFDETWYEYIGGDWVLTDKAYLRTTGTKIYHRGRGEWEDGDMTQQWMWDEPMEYLRLPVQDHLGEGWPISATTTIDDTTTVEISGTIVIQGGLDDIINEPIGGTFVDCIRWRLDIDMTMYVRGVEVDTSAFRQTFWLAPGIGPVMRVNEDIGTASEPDTLKLVGFEF
jgi:hypothetical protein